MLQFSRKLLTLAKERVEIPKPISSEKARAETKLAGGKESRNVNLSLEAIGVLNTGKAPRLSLCWAELMQLLASLGPIWELWLPLCVVVLCQGVPSVSHPLGQNWHTEHFTSARSNVPFSCSQHPPRKAEAAASPSSGSLLAQCDTAPLQSECKTQGRGEGRVVMSVFNSLKMGVWHYPWHKGMRERCVTEYSSHLLWSGQQSCSDSKNNGIS